MRHKYQTRGIVLARSSSGEANTFITLMTPSLGLVRARAQGLRRSGAKLAAALSTFVESDVVLVRGKEGWRVTGAVPSENWFIRMQHMAARARASRISNLLLRLVAGEVQEEQVLFAIITGFFDALATLSEEAQDAAEVLAALRILAALGLDTGDIPGEPASYTTPLMETVKQHRAEYIVRINRGIAASEL
jgi:DNA repair protein RecO (recombination protein O)